MSFEGFEGRIGILVEGRSDLAGFDDAIRAEERLQQTTAQLGRQLADAKRQSQDLAHEIKQLGVAQTFGANVGDRLGAAHAALAQKKAEIARLTRQLTQQQSNLSAVTDDLSQRLANQAGVFGQLAARMGPVGLGIAAGAAAASALGLATFTATRQIASFQEQADIAAATFGLTTGQLAGLRVAAAESGRSFEQIQPSLAIFTRTLGDAAAGNEQAVKAFERLGVSVTIGNRIRPTADVLRDVQDVLRNTTSESERMSKAFDVFGRGAAGSLSVLLTPLDEAEAKARKLGVALGPESERVARQADQAFDMLGTSLLGLRNSFGVLSAEIMGGFLVDLAKMSSDIAEFVQKPEVQFFIEKFMRTGGDPVRAVVETVLTTEAMGGPGFAPNRSTLEQQRFLEGLGVPGAERRFALQPRNGIGDLTTTEPAKDDIGEAIRQVERMVALQPELIDAGIAKLEGLRAQVDTQAELNRLIEVERGLLAQNRDLLLEDRPFIGAMPGPPVANDFRFTGPNLEESRRERGLGIPMPDAGEPTVDISFTSLEQAIIDVAEAGGDYEALLRNLADATMESDGATVGFIATLELSKGTMLDLGATAARGLLRVSDNFGELVGSMLVGSGQIEDQWEQMKDAMIQMIAQIAAAAVAQQIGGAVGGPAGAAVGGLIVGIGSMFQEGGTVAHLQAGGTIGGDGSWLRPFEAQAGLVVNGTRGIDGVHAYLGKDESVLDHSLTDAMRTLVPDLQRWVDAGYKPGVAGLSMQSIVPTDTLRAISGNTGPAPEHQYLADALRELIPELQRSARGQRGGQTVHVGEAAVQVTVHGGVPRGAALDDWVQSDLVPALGRAIRRGF